jgi:hypothetical protein
MEKRIFKGFQFATGALTVVFVFLSYGGDPVAWAAAVGMSVAALLTLFLPES